MKSGVSAVAFDDLLHAWEMPGIERGEPGAVLDRRSSNESVAQLNVVGVAILATFAAVLCLCVAGSVTAAADNDQHEFRVGLVVTGALNDPFNQAALAGLTRAENRIDNVNTSVAVAPPGGAQPYLSNFAARATTW